MATPQGNFSAYIPLKPTEMKVGEIITKWTDNFIKRGEAEKAAKAKLMAEERKSMRDILKDIKTDSFATTSNFQDVGNKLFNDVSKAIAHSKMLAETDFENRYQHMSRAQRLADEYKMIATSFSNKDFIDKYNAKMTALQNKDLFLDTSENEKAHAIARGMWDYRIDSDGSIKFALPNSGDAKMEEYAKLHSVGEVLNLYTAPDELDMLRNTKSNGNTGLLDNVIPDTAKKMQDAWEHNKDGNKTMGWKGFAEERAKQWFDDRYGEYEANNIPVELRQYAKRYLKKSIENKEDYEAVKQGLVNLIGSYVPRENTTDTKHTQAEMEYQRLRNRNLQLQIEEKEWERAMGYPSKRSSGSGGGSGSDDSEVVTIQGYSKIKGGYYDTSGLGTRVSLGENKHGFIIANWNPNGGKNGKGGIAFSMGMPAEGGGISIRPLGRTGDPTGLNTAMQYMSDKQRNKFLEGAGAYYSNVNNRKAPIHMKKGVPSRYGDDTIFSDLRPFLGQSDNNTTKKRRL